MRTWSAWIERVAIAVWFAAAVSVSCSSSSSNNERRDSGTAPAKEYRARFPGEPTDVEALVVLPDGSVYLVSKGNNALRPGIAAVSARLANGTLRVVEGSCPNLLAEAGLYRYSTEREERRAETPVDEHNHALAALRYLVCGLDGNGAAYRKGPKPEDRPRPRVPWWRDPTTEGMWTQL